MITFRPSTSQSFRAAARRAGLAVAIAIVLSAGAAAVYRWLKPSPEVLAPRGARIEDYVGAATCAECHQDISDRQGSSRMATTLQPVEQFLRERSLPLPATVFDAVNQLHYRVDEHDGKLRLEVKRGSAVAHADMTYALGSGKLAITFVRELDAENYQELRVSYYSQTGGWDLTPGQRSARPAWVAEALGRPIGKHGDQGCLTCHSSLLVQSGGTIDGHRSHFNVECERCHGAGRAHVEAAHGGEFAVLRAPELSEALGAVRRLREGERPESPSEELLQSFAPLDDERLLHDLYVCGECHGRARLADRPTDVHMSKFPVAALAQSACYQRSATKLLCGDCHDPHGDSPRDDRPYVAVCLRCHRSDFCPENSNNECIACHMPVRSPIPHTQYTDHRIAIYRPAKSSATHDRGQPGRGESAFGSATYPHPHPLADEQTNTR